MEFRGRRPQPSAGGGSAAAGGFATLGEVLRRRAARQGERTAFTFLTYRSAEPDAGSLSYAGLLSRAEAVAAALAARCARGERALILCPPGLDYIAAFFGCLLSGIVAVPAYPPRNARHLARLAAIAGDAGARLVLTVAAMGGRLADWGGGRLPPLVAVDELPDGRLMPEPSLSPADLAFLQYTSGTTGSPKGVMISHGNLMANMTAAMARCRFDERDIHVSWLPPYHDLGLVGTILQPVHVGKPSVLMAPAAFLQEPLRWLRAIADHRGTVSGGPNFAYELCCGGPLPERLDLSSWRCAASGGEPPRAATLERFAARFARFGFDPASFYPGYGMAETTLQVTNGRRQRRPAVRAIAVPGGGATLAVSNGTALDGHEIRIVDPDSRRALPDGVAGEVWIAGPTVAQGYWNQPELTAETFGARLEGDPSAGPYLRSGDLGVLLEGELYVLGRRKEVIIVRGRNHAAHDIEATVAASHPALAPDSTIAFAVERDGTEQLVVVQELGRRALRDLDAPALLAAIRGAVVAAHEIDPAAILLIRPATLPRTTSGKLQRIAAREQYRSGRLAVVAAWHAGEAADALIEDLARLPAAQRHGRLVEQLGRWLQQELGLAEPPGPEQGFAPLGVDSLAAVRLGARLSEALRLEPPLPATALFDQPNLAALATLLEARLGPAPAAPAVAAAAAPAAGPIAIVGMAARLPGAADLDSFWALLAEGRDAVRAVPRDRFDIDALYDPDPEAPGRCVTRRGAFLEGVDLFDAAFFGISAREAAALDPQHRLLLETAWEALEAAGLRATAMAGSRAGVFLGLSTHDYADLLQARGLAALDAHAGIGNAASAAAGRISHLLGLTGPSLVLDTACSSSLVAVHQACQSLRRGECGLALAGGASLILSPAGMVALSRARMLAPDGVCKSFDAAADGYGRGEGAAMLVLKPLEAAERDGDPVLAVIRGSAVNQDGASAGLTVPNGPAQERVIAAALAEAGLAPADIAYLEAHGTGTALGDPIELQAAARALGPGRAADRKLLVGSVKASIGHLEAAAGVAGLVKVVLALQRGELPPQAHFRTPNPHLPWAELPLEVVTRRRAWPGERRIAGISSFGFTGTNCHLVVEGHAAPVPPAEADDAAAPQVLALSAKEPAALHALAGRLAAWIRRHPDATGAELAAAAARRDAFTHRAALAVAPGEDPVPRLERLAAGTPDAATWTGARRTPPRLGLLLTGQGSQRPGTGRALYRREPAFRLVLDRCAAVLGDALDPPLLAVMLAEPGTPAAALLERTRYTQPALFALQAGLLALWRERGLAPAAALGHSVGAFAAAHAAGLLDLEDGIALVARRGALMDALPAGGRMAAVFAPPAAIAAALAGSAVELAADNGTHQVVSGPAAAVEAVLARLAGDGVRCEPLATSHAFHSALIEPALAPLEAAVPPAAGRAATLTLVSDLTGAALPPEAVLDGGYWRRHARAPVQFRRGVAALADLGVDLLLELGPRPVLAPLVVGSWPEGRSLPGAVASLRPDCDEQQAIAEAVARLYAAGAAIDTGPNTGPGRRDGLRRLALPPYPFQRRRHWLDAVPQTPEPAAAEAGEPPSAAIRKAVARALRCDPATLAEDRPLAELGLDSVMAMEVAAALAGRLPVALGAAAVTGAATIASLSARVAGGPVDGPERCGLASRPRLERDAALAPEIRPPAGAPHPAGPPERILLTGAGGFLGAALLARLLARSDAAIRCLVRPGTRPDRLRAALPDDPALAAAFAARVTLVEGDLQQPRLGLAPAAWDALAAEVDAVVHAAARVNWLQSYDDLAPLNVEGTRAMLRFACAGRRKALHLVSTLGVFPGGLPEAEDLALEGMVPEPAAERFESAYAQTKCVAERLAAAARERGLPVSVYRMDFLTGAADGAMPWRYIVPRAIAAAVELGALPDVAVLIDLLPTAAVAEAVAALALAPEALGGSYHLLNRRPLRLAELRDLLAAFGYPVAMVPYDAWLARIAAAPGCSLHPFLEFLRGVAPLLPRYAGFRVDDTQARTLLAAAAPGLADGLPGPLAICRAIVGDLLRAGRIPPPAWRCRLRLSGPDAVAAAERERTAGLALERVEAAGEATAAWPLPALATDGGPLRGSDLAPGERETTRRELRGAVQASLRALAARLAVPPALVIEAATLVALWRARHAPALADDRLVLARAAEASPLLGLPAAGFALQAVALQEELGFAALVDRLSRPAAAAGDAPVDLFVLHRRAADDGVRRAAGALDGGPPGPLLDIACDRRATILDWHDAPGGERPAGPTLLAMATAILADAAARPEAPIGGLALVEPTVGAGLLSQLSPPATLPLPPILETIAAQAARAPDAVAVTAESGTLTYAGLLARAGSIAAALAAAGAGGDRPVGLCLARTPDLVAALLATHWAGAAYLPLDPEHPLERRRACLAQAGAVLVVTDAAGDLEGGPARTVPLDRLDPEASPPPPLPGPRAYVIFTSGSTGRPKAVAVRQAALANHVAAMQDRLRLSPGDTLLAVTTPAFDIAALELLLPLAAGGRVALASRAAARDGAALAAALAASGATVMQATPATWAMLLEAGWPGRPGLLALCGGEALAPSLAARLLPRVGALWNLYGPTEATIWATAQPVDFALLEACAEQPCLPLGAPLAGLGAAVLDDRLAPLPDGVAGELYLAGAGLADGYLGDPAGTAERFPALAAGQRLYRTGDRVRRADGALLFLGRRDDQIKHRGHRIEPGEIEAHLRRHPGVADAAVALRDDAPGGPALVAYLAAPAPIGTAALRDWLGARLPAYLLPEMVVTLPRLPVGPTGKLDRRALPAPRHTAADDAHWCPPRSATERRLAALWQELLGVAAVGIHDSFFALHGHSLAAATLFARIARDFGVRLPVRTLAEAHRLAELAAAIDAAIAGEKLPASPGEQLERLRADAALPERIRPPPERPAAAPAAVLLTGATGFLGGHLLAALIAGTAARIHCLVRGTSAEEAGRRLVASLTEAGLWRPGWAERIVVHAGDLEADGLGLDAATSHRLADEVGAIYHCGARVALTEPYALLRRTNVAATLHLLALACAGRAKAFHHVSTLSVFDQPALLDGRAVAEEAEPPLGPFLTGYAASKWVAERLVLAARARGLAATIHRPGTIAGDAASGRWPVHDAIPSMVRGCIELGAVPDLDIAMAITPVGAVAAAIVAATRAGGPGPAAFHPIADRQVSLADIVLWLGRLGYPLEPLPYEAWRGRLRRALMDGTAGALAGLAPLFLEPLPEAGGLTVPELFRAGRRLRFGNRAAAALMGPAALAAAAVDEAMFGRFVAYWQAIEHLPPPR
jgi:amino acid adenylation domain-containing protein/thioester reductase-like protein